MSGTFKLLKKINLSEITPDTEIPESDYSLLTQDGHFLQFKYHEKEIKYNKYDVKPGIWKIVKSSTGMFLQPTTFTNDQILEEFVNTKNIEEIVDSFFDNLHRYKEFGIEIPKRNLLLYGPPGTGKSTALAKCAKKYAADGKTVIVTWDTACLESYEVKSFINSFNYIDSEKIIVVAEDIGGMENAGQPVRSDSSLLSLLDNTDKTFTIPVMIISTTNHPENLAGSIANRSGRFDDKVEVGYPPSKARSALLSFFCKKELDKDVVELIESRDCEKFPPSDLREVYIRSELRKKTLIATIKEKINEIKLYEKAFDKNTRGVGF